MLNNEKKEEIANYITFAVKSLLEIAQKADDLEMDYFKIHGGAFLYIAAKMAGGIDDFQKILDVIEIQLVLETEENKNNINNKEEIFKLLRQIEKSFKKE